MSIHIMFQYHIKFQNHHRHHFIKYPSLFFIAYIFRSSRLLSFFNPRRKYLNNKDELNWLNSSDVLSCSQPKFCANSQNIMTKIYYTYHRNILLQVTKILLEMIFLLKLIIGYHTIIIHEFPLILTFKFGKHDFKEK